MDFSLLSLFVGATLAATLLPVSSELMLLAALDGQIGPPALLVVIATLGNTLGCWLNWIAGRYLLRYQDRRWFPVPQKSLARATGWFNRWGLWCLLLSWIPIVGDPLTVAAGVLRVPVGRFLLLTMTGRFLRYLAVCAGYLNAI
jgi:membrane protein YqaA with SNARE-associated domain